MKKTTVLEYTRENKSGKLGPAESAKLEAVSKSYLSYLGASKTEREAHDEAIKLLKAAGYRDLDELISSETPLKPGDKVYRSCAGKTLMAGPAALALTVRLRKAAPLVGGITVAG